jgi:hypothetical protein
MSALIRLYPAAWRARYGSEFKTLLAERSPSARDLVDIFLGAVDARLSPQVAAEPVTRRPAVTDRLAGAAAIIGGLIWSVTYVGGWLLQAEGDLSLPILIALAMMLLSLPGTYLARYASRVVLAGLALAGSFAVLIADVLPWGPMVILPALTILGLLGPGALALAAARAGIAARDRWRLLLLTVPWPVVGVFAVLAGFVPTTVPVWLVIASMLPLGIAWMVTGARIVAGKGLLPSTTTGGLA